MPKICPRPQCREINPDSAWVCISCGATLTASTKRNQIGDDKRITKFMPSERKLIEKIEAHAKTLAEALALAEYWYDKTVQSIDQELKGRQAEIETQYAQSMSEAAQNYEMSLGRVKADLDALASQYGIAELGWDAPQWRSFKPVSGNTVPRLTRVGRLIAQGRFGQIQMPALLPIIGSRNVVIRASGSGKERARAAIQSVLLRLVGTLPPGKLRLVCIDPVGLGSTMAGFIKGLPESLTGGQASFEQRAIEEKMTELERHMAFVKQKYLGVSFATMEEYNEKADQVEEPYRILVISDFPARFTDSAAQQLISIATNGPGTGVYVIIMVDTDQPKMPYSFNLDDLERTATVIIAKPDGNSWRDPDFKDCRLDFDSPPPAEAFEGIVKMVGEAAVDASDIRVPFAHFIPQEKEIWHGDTRTGIHVPIGHFGAREIQVFSFDEKLLSSALVIGKTGSGKSTLLHILINSLALAYSPEELELYLLDFKQVEFKDYALFGLPHARVIAVKSEREFGMSVLRGLDAELQRRKDTFGNITSLSEYRAKTSKKLPRIVLIADEFQELFSYDDALAREAGMILDRLVRQGRAFGINIILASQTLAGPNTFSSATRNQIPARIALQCADADSRLILSDDNDRAKYLERPGEAIYNAANGRLEGNNRFQIAWLNEDERKDYIRRLRNMTERLPEFAIRKPIIFDGDANAEVENNVELMGLLDANDWALPVRGRSPTVWVGEPIEIKPHTAIPLKRQSRSNLLIVGQNEYEESTVAMLLMAILSLAAQQRPEAAHFILMNLSDIDAPWSDLPASLARSLPHSIREVKRRGVAEAVAEVTSEIARRISSDDDEKWPSLYLVIIGLHKARDLRREDGYYPEPDKDPPPFEQVAKIIREGPDVGVHTLTWCDTYANLLRVFDRRALSEFDLRVVLQMGPDDSRNLVDSDAASKLGFHRALYYDEERSGRLEKFRPYALPTADWLAQHSAHLAKRANNK